MFLPGVHPTALVGTSYALKILKVIPWQAYSEAIIVILPLTLVAVTTSANHDDMLSLSPLSLSLSLISGSLTLCLNIDSPPSFSDSFWQSAPAQR